MDNELSEIEIICPGTLSYADGLALQEELRQKVKDGSSGYLVLLQHTPVITNGRFAGGDNFSASLDLIREKGVDVYKTDRGGDLTYHGPGQLVAYPVIPLRQYKLRPRAYIDLLEEALIGTLREFGIDSRRRPGYPGVWVSDAEGSLIFKIASIGVSVKSGVTSHGCALNVSTDLSYFSLIVPCGIPGIEAVSMEKILDRQTDIEAVADTFARVFTGLLNPSA